MIKVVDSSLERGVAWSLNTWVETGLCGAHGKALRSLAVLQM